MHQASAWPATTGPAQSASTRTGEARLIAGPGYELRPARFGLLRCGDRQALPPLLLELHPLPLLVLVDDVYFHLRGLWRVSLLPGAAGLAVVPCLVSAQPLCNSSALLSSPFEAFFSPCGAVHNRYSVGTAHRNRPGPRSSAQCSAKLSS